MLTSFLTRVVGLCARHCWTVVLAALVLAAISGTYFAHHFAIDTNVNDLLSRDLPCRQRELQYQAAFPQSTQSILVVVQGATPELTDAATRALVQGIAKRADLFRSVDEEGGGAFFRHNRLLYLPPPERARTMGPFP